MPENNLKNVEIKLGKINLEKLDLEKTIKKLQIIFDYIENQKGLSVR